MNERAYSRNYEEHCGKNYYRGYDAGRSRAHCERRSRYSFEESKQMSFYDTYQVPLMMLGSFLSGVLLVIGALA